jgi:Bacterial Ig domain/Glycosyl hydrolase family 26
VREKRILSRFVASCSLGLCLLGALAPASSATAQKGSQERVAPKVTIRTPSAGAKVSGTISVAGSASDNVAVARVEVRVDSTAWTSASGTKSWSYSLKTALYTNGSHKITVRATDTAGNKATASVAVTVANGSPDTTAPTISITTPSAGAAVSGTTSVGGSVSDNGTLERVELRVDAGPYVLVSGTSSWSYALNTLLYANGIHTVTVRATDSAGNQALESSTVTVANADTQPPTVTFASPAPGATLSASVTVSGTAVDDSGVAKVEMQVDGGPVITVSGLASWTTSLDTAVYAAGSHTITVRATDTSGNTGRATLEVTMRNAGPGPIYWGAFMEGTQTYSYLYGGSWGNAPWSSTTWHAFESHAGKKVSIVHWGASPPWTHDFNYYLSTFDLVQNAGDLSLVGMLTGSVPLKDIASGKYDASLKTWVQQAAAWGHPFFLLLDPEMNGTWEPYSPGKNGNTAADFINAWRHFHDLAVSAGAKNITWVWCPNVDPWNMFTPYAQLYPGDAYVDWTGFNGFDKDGKSSFNWLFGSSYNALRQIAPTKPILISETAADELGNKAGWIADAFSTQLPKNFPQIKAVVWFNWRFYQNSKWWNYEIESTPSAQQAFNNAISSPYYLAGGGLGNLPLRTKITPP